ncbi:hypothetical protein [Streptomyces sp. RFCAC02]|uniref:hypothetical protein n=1 Tax=Streptomyces sp. RFCAC02 TaxID=2499143 RepID=UPI00101F580D|nr:hypothetical protein [Streptomyces sp. RFCAC02]
MLSACGGPSEREYALPETLCGVGVDQALYDPLLPPGDELETPWLFENHGPFTMHQCLLLVDGEEAVRAFTSSDMDFEKTISREDLGVDLNDAVERDGAYEVRVWPGVAMARMECHANQLVSVTLTVEAPYPEDDEESVRVLSDLIEPFMDATMQLIPCEEFEEEAGE